MTANTVLLVTASYDLAPLYVGAALERRGVPFFRQTPGSRQKSKQA